MPDERGIARGLCGAGLVVDLGRQQHRSAGFEPTRHELIEMRFVTHPVAAGDARATRDRDDIGGHGRRGLLLAGDLIDAVVHDHDREVARLDHADGGKTPHRHQDRAVAFERNHAALRLRQRDTCLLYTSRCV